MNAFIEPDIYRMHMQGGTIFSHFHQNPRMPMLPQSPPMLSHTTSK